MGTRHFSASVLFKNPSVKFPLFGSPENTRAGACVLTGK